MKTLGLKTKTIVPHMKLYFTKINYFTLQLKVKVTMTYSYTQICRHVLKHTKSEGTRQNILVNSMAS